MATSTLDLENIPEPDRQLGKGHGTRALGPSDISDTGSDVQPGLHAIEELDLGLERGTSEDSCSRTLPVSGDSDSAGTGERGSAGRDGDVEEAGDIDVDRIDATNQGEEGNLSNPEPPSQQRASGVHSATSLRASR
jgi:hypothetical protein